MATPKPTTNRSSTLALTTQPLGRSSQTEPGGPERSAGAATLRRVIFLLIAAMAFAPGLASALDAPISWIPQDDLADGYRVYFAQPHGSFGTPVGLGSPHIDADGQAVAYVSADVIDANIGGAGPDRQVDMAMTAYNADGESALSNRVTMTLPWSSSQLPDVQVSSGPSYYSEGFSTYQPGEDPVDWVDTAADNSTVTSQTEFETLQARDEVVFGTTSRARDIHSHMASGTSSAWSDYEFRGRLMATDAASGVGVTVFSDYPNSDIYYRLSASDGSTFKVYGHLPGGEAFRCVGPNDSGVSPFPWLWYQFRFQAYVLPEGTMLRAKVWSDLQSEPGDWQIACGHLGTNSLVAGSVGVWAAGDGLKYWDQLEVLPLQPDSGLSQNTAESGGDPTPNPLPNGVIDFEDEEIGTDPFAWFDTGRNSSMAETDALFKVAEVAGGSGSNYALGTFSRNPDIHSHFVDVADSNLFNYEFTGRMQAGLSTGGVGVTVYSDYPNSDSYYRLGADPRDNFRLATRVDGMEGVCSGSTDSGIQAESMTWFEFRVQAYDSPGGTRIRAKIWNAATFEPGQWQIDCLDSTADVLVGGLPGAWATGSGQRYWDDLELIPLTLP